MSTAKTRQAICQQVARLLREERERQGLSMTQLGKTCGLSQQSISYVERGMRIPNLDTLLNIAAALKLDLSSVLRQAGS